MFNTPKSVKSLRAYYKDRTAPASIDHLTQEVTGESDPAFVILLASILEDVLIHRVAKHLSFTPNETEFDHIFRFEGPLGTASARIEIAYLFGFIDERTRGQLDDIREMRNACAHSKQQMDFGVPVLANVAKRLFHPQGIAHLIEDSRNGIRRTFFMEFLFLHQILLEGSRERGEASVRAELLTRGAVIPSPDKPTPP
jgi:hypothetical protein